ncbi:NfeD family protein [Thermococcus sp.]
MEALKLLVLLADEVLIIVLFLLLFPQLGLRVPLWAILLLLAVLLAKDIAVAPYVLRGSLERKPEVGPESLIGKTAVVLEDLDPEGIVKVEGELWRALCLNGKASRGDKVLIVGVRGTTALVECREVTGENSVEI